MTLKPDIIILAQGLEFIPLCGNSRIGRWLADRRPGLSPYNYVQNNPLIRIDPTGMLDDWVEYKHGNIYWDDNAKL